MTPPPHHSGRQILLRSVQAHAYALPATVGLPQVRANGSAELRLVTAGDDLANLAQFLPPGRDAYSAADVLRVLLPPPDSQAGSEPDAP